MVLAWAATLLLLARRRLGATAQFLVGLLAIQVALNAVYDIRVLYLVGRSVRRRDAWQQLFLLPAAVWATAWMLVAIAMLGATIWKTRGAR